LAFPEALYKGRKKRKENKKMLHYADGCNNRYKISSECITYDPVRPEESSSGEYSGGQPYSKKIDPEQYIAIKKVFLEAFEDHSSQTDKRMMMTGQISMEGKNRVILKNKSNAQKKIEAILKQ
jgi:hypothetical protein